MYEYKVCTSNSRKLLNSKIEKDEKAFKNITMRLLMAYKIYQRTNSSESEKWCGLYHSLFDDNINTVQDPAMKCWLLGRQLISLDFKTYQTKINKLLDDMGTILNNHAEQQINPYLVWAQGYLAVYYARNNKNENYEQTIEKTLIECSKLQDQTCKLWGYVMCLMAAGKKKDYENYQNIVLQIMQFDKESGDFIKALKKIPMNDFQTWAMAIAMEAAAILNNDKDLQLLSTAITYNMVSETMDKYDKALTTTYFNSAHFIKSSLHDDAMAEQPNGSFVCN